MSFIQARINKCDFVNCGHEWFSGKKIPDRCAKCKRKNWNRVLFNSKGKGKDVVAIDTGKEVTIDGYQLPDNLPIPESAIASIQLIKNRSVGLTGDLLTNESTAVGWEKPLPLVVSAGTAAAPSERLQEVIKDISQPTHKVGEKCKHGWANWLVCPECNPKANTNE